MTIDYSKVSEQIVKQAWSSTKFVLDREQVKQLIEGKVIRAEATLIARSKEPNK